MSKLDQEIFLSQDSQRTRPSVDEDQTGINTRLFADAYKTAYSYASTPTSNALTSGLITYGLSQAAENKLSTWLKSINETSTDAFQFHILDRRKDLYWKNKQDAVAQMSASSVAHSYQAQPETPSFAKASLHGLDNGIAIDSETRTALTHHLAELERERAAYFAEKQAFTLQDAALRSLNISDRIDGTKTTEQVKLAFADYYSLVRDENTEWIKSPEEHTRKNWQEKYFGNRTISLNSTARELINSGFTAESQAKSLSEFTTTIDNYNFKRLSYFGELNYALASSFADNSRAVKYSLSGLVGITVLAYLSLRNK